MTASIPTGLVAELSELLHSSHADYLLPGLATVLTEHTRPVRASVPQPARVFVDVALVGRVFLLLDIAGQLALLPRILDTARPNDRAHAVHLAHQAGYLSGVAS